MAASLVILVVMVGIAATLNPSREQFAWFLSLRRPAWLTFERWIPLIWISIYTCFYSSAVLAWFASASWGVMGGYLGLLLLVQSYTLIICRTHNVARGTVIGLGGWLWGAALAVVVQPESPQASGLLIPYLLWSPLGTLLTWQMQHLNR